MAQASARVQKRHLVILVLILICLFVGILGTSCQDGACGGNPEGFEVIGYIAWVFGLILTCVGIAFSQPRPPTEDEETKN